MTHATKPHSIPTSRRAIVGAAIVAACLAATGCDGETTHPPRNDVDSGWTCEAGADIVRASGTITNHSSKASSYVIDVEFRVGDDVIAERGAMIDDVQPGETTRVETVAPSAGAGEVTCLVANVERFKA